MNHGERIETIARAMRGARPEEVQHALSAHFKTQSRPLKNGNIKIVVYMPKPAREDAPKLPKPRRRSQTEMDADDWGLG